MQALLSNLIAYFSSAGVASAIRDPKSLLALLAMTIVVMYGLSVGRTKALVSLLAMYVAYMLTVLFPFFPWFSQRTPDRYHAVLAVGAFLTLYGVVFGLLSHAMRKTRLSLGEISILQVLLISVVQIGLLTSIVVSLLPADRAMMVLGPLRTVFAGSKALWSWAAASLLILPLMKSRTRE